MGSRYYVKVFVADVSYHSRETLTYASDRPLPTGSLVFVPLKNKTVAGLISTTTAEPGFTVKSVQHAPQLPPIPNQAIKLLYWMREYYPAPLGVTTSLFLPSKLSPKLAEFITPHDATPMKESRLPPLTEDQHTALNAINSSGMHLLHGDTGTGKTRVYIELARKALSQKKSAIILTPEIGLTAQLVRDFRSVFGNRVVLLHSKMTATVRLRIWLHTLKAQEPLIVIGPRSTLFCPLRNIGLIVVDESHDTAYKQDSTPHYHASHVAAKLAALHGGTLLLGSATPLINDYAMAVAKQRPIIRMRQAATTATSAAYDTHVVDLRNRDNLTSSPYLSNKLIALMRTALANNEQVLLFLNRRGTARVVFCEACGWQAVCPHCDLPLIYHGDTHRMRCHTCSYHAPSPSICPDCKNNAVLFKSIGTKAIVDHVSTYFPDAKIQRFDTDNKASERMEKHLEAVHRGDTDIIVGTQTIAKGIDLPRLSLVGVIMADTSLSFPDFSASERTYQLLSQVMGRIGRGHRAGAAVIQTYNPTGTTLTAVLAKNWHNFYENELAERRRFVFPPFCYLLKLTCRRASATTAAQAGEQLAQKIRRLQAGLTVEGPAPSFHEKIQNKYQWQLVVKAKRRADLLAVIQILPANWSYDIDPVNLL